MKKKNKIINSLKEAFMFTTLLVGLTLVAVIIAIVVIAIIQAPVLSIGCKIVILILGAVLLPFSTTFIASYLEK